MSPENVEFVQIAEPSRMGLSAYRELRLDVERRAHDVASNWLRSDGTPAMRLVTEPCDRRYVAAILSAADVALVTPERDGMNLGAKECSIYNEPRAGVLVLGKGAGAADELADSSLLVDGSDRASIAAGIARAVGLGESARRDMARRRADAVRSWTSQHRASDFNDDSSMQSIRANCRTSGRPEALPAASRVRRPWRRRSGRWNCWRCDGGARSECRYRSHGD